MAKEMTKQAMIEEIKEAAHEAYVEMREIYREYGIASQKGMFATARWRSLDRLCSTLKIDYKQ